MWSRIQILLAMLVFVACTQPLLAQLPDVGTLFLTGKVVNESKKGMPATIYLYKNGLRIEDFPTSSNGKFEFTVPLQDSLAFVVYADGYISKSIYVNSFVPLKRKNEDFSFPFFIDLYPIGNTPANIDLQRPVGRIVFASTQFIYDIEFTKKQNTLLKEFVIERRNMKIRPIGEE